MPQVAFFNIPAYGHTNPTLPVVAELVQRGQQVTYYSKQEFRQAIEQTGATFHQFRDVPVSNVTGHDGNLIRFARTLLEVTQDAIPALLPALSADPPDYIIHDSLCPWGAYLARLLDVPAICSVTTFALSTQLPLSMPLLERELLRTAAGSMADLARFHALASELKRSYHIPRPRLRDVFANHEPLNIVYTSRSFQPSGDTFDDSYKFVGPSISARPDAPDFPFDALGDQSILYISLGTVFNQQPHFYRLCFDAFSSLDRHVVMSVGSKIDLAALGSPPSNFILRPYVPQLQLMQQSALFVTHGGMNSVNEALYYGVPLVVIPQGADQRWVAERVQTLGAGQVVGQERLDAAKLRRAVEEVLSTPSYREASERIGASLREAGRYCRAADEIQEYVRRCRKQQG